MSKLLQEHLLGLSSMGCQVLVHKLYNYMHIPLKFLNHKVLYV